MDDDCIIGRRSHKSVHFFTSTRILLQTDQISLLIFLIEKSLEFFVDYQNMIFLIVIIMIILYLHIII